MAERWDERDRGNWRDERGYRGPERDRGAMNRGADEVRSWFGDDEAARRRQMDELRDDRDDREWRNRSNPADRTWDRARETMRDATDRDRDGRRGFSEWNDNDRPWDRSRPATFSGPAVRGRDEPWTADRQYGDRTSYTTSDAYGGSRGSATSLSTGQYAGRGPRGYKRGDERIREDVCDRLTDDSRIDASDVDVAVKDGEVTLAGSVRSREEKRFAEDLIEHVSGVRDVNNNLKVKAADEVIGTARSGSSVLGLTDTPPPPPAKK
jgi:hypothetical protein